MLGILLCKLFAWSWTPQKLPGSRAWNKTINVLKIKKIFFSGDYKIKSDLKIILSNLHESTWIKKKGIYHDKLTHYVHSNIILTEISFFKRDIINKSFIYRLYSSLFYSEISRHVFFFKVLQTSNMPGNTNCANCQFQARQGPLKECC